MRQLQARMGYAQGGRGGQVPALPEETVMDEIQVGQVWEEKD